VPDISKHYRQIEFLKKLYQKNIIPITDTEACLRRSFLVPKELPDDDYAFKRALLSVGIAAGIPSSV
jgi:hypothetical protein